jgi:hypothetical protein
MQSPYYDDPAASATDLQDYYDVVPVSKTYNYLCHGCAGTRYLDSNNQASIRDSPF